MANRYWVGGAGSWNGTNTTNWSDTSGGAGGASVPTSADDVFFDSNSNGASSFSVTLATGNTGAKSITCTGFTRSLTGSASITVSGNVTLVSGMSFSCSGTWTFNASATIVSAGKTFAAITVNGVGITVQQGDALNLGTARTLTLTNGAFLTNNYNLTCRGISTSNSNVRTLNLGTSTVTLDYNFSAATSTNLTFSGASATIAFTGSSGAVSCSGLTFGDVTVSGVTSIAVTGDANTFANLTLSAATSAGSVYAIFYSGASHTITGTLTVGSPTYPAYRRTVRAGSFGSQVTLTCNAVSSLTDVNFGDIVFAGNCISGGNITGTRLGDIGGNSNITFGAGKTAYFVGLAASSTNYWGVYNAWSLTAGGAADPNAFPLPQDNAVVGDTYPGAGETLYIDSDYYVTDITISRSNALSLERAAGASPSMYLLGDFLTTNVVTASASTIFFYFIGGAQSIDTQNATLTLAIFSPRGASTVLSMASALNCYQLYLYPTSEFTSGNYSLTTVVIDVEDGAALTAGSGTWTFTFNGFLNIRGAAATLTLDSASQFVFSEGGTISAYGQPMPQIVKAGNTYGLTLINYTGYALYRGLTCSGTTGVTFANTMSPFTRYVFQDTFAVSGSAGNLRALDGGGNFNVQVYKPGQWAIGANSTVTNCVNIAAVEAGQGLDYIAASDIIGNTLSSGFFLE